MAVALVASGVAACAGSDDSNSSLLDRVMGLDLSAKPEQSVRGIANSARPGRSPETQIYMGTGTGSGSGAGASSRSAPSGATPAGHGEYDLNFENADVKTVSKVILGDVLGGTFVVDPRVEGTISLSSARPVAQRDILPLLEDALKLNGAVVVNNGGTYQVLLATEAAGSGGAVDVGRRRVSPGYGISVLPLENVSADTVLKLIDGFGAPAGTVRVDAGRNLLIAQGTSQERASVMDTALAFDVDWMRGQSVGVFPLKNAAPEAMIAELNRIMDSQTGGLGSGLVRFQPVTRLNAVLAISQQPKQIQQIATWVRRLDMADEDNARLRVYRVQHGDARRIAMILNNVFNGGSQSDTASGTTGDLNQLSPGSSTAFGGSTGSSSSSGDQSSSTTSSANSAQSGGLLGGSSSSDDPTNSESGMQSGDQDTGDAASGTGATTPGGQPLLQNVRITADVANNSLLIYADRDSYHIIERALADIDRPALQVAIEAMIAEVTLNGELSYGVQYYLKGSDVGLPDDAGSVSFFGTSNTKRLTKTGPGFNLVLGPERNPRFVLDALRKVTNVKVLSSPSLVVVDNQTATLQVGNQVPVTTQSATNVTTADAAIVNSVEYRNTGVILRVTPRVSANGVVNLDVEQEISSVVNNTNEETLTPTISQRRVKSQVAVTNGQTVVLAGLIQEQVEKTKQGIPIVSDVPYIGDLLSSTSTKSDRTELVIFIKPQIVRDSLDAQLIAEELRLKLVGGARP